ncbi:MAG: Asp23/Gls24 family envelope stress response protein [Eubacterium sp.]|nr:Asp23/Gls24 family envelope stress response protein [Eubacterium sp.]
MSEKEKDTNIVIDEESAGVIKIADDVIASIVGLAVTEVDGVSKLTGGVSRDIIAKLGKNSLANGVRVLIEGQLIKVDISIVVKFGYNILEVSREIQEKVKSTLLTMTGLECKSVNVRVSNVDFGE